MISYIRGTLSEVAEDLIVVEAGSVGVNIRVPASVLDSLPRVGEEVMIYTYLKVAEDSLTLYGFSSRRDLDMFRQLIAVSGIGPKGALAILSALSPDDLRMAVISGDAKAIQRAQGIGARTASRVILELKDKVSLDDVSFMPKGGEAVSGTHGGTTAMKEAMEALVQLGYSASEAARAVRSVSTPDDTDAEAVLKAALRSLVR